MTNDEIVTLLRKQIAACSNTAEWCRKTGVPASYVSRMINGKMNTVPSVLLRGLGLERVTKIRKVKP